MGVIVSRFLEDLRLDEKRPHRRPLAHVQVGIAPPDLPAIGPFEQRDGDHRGRKAGADLRDVGHEHDRAAGHQLRRRHRAVMRPGTAGDDRVDEPGLAGETPLHFEWPEAVLDLEDPATPAAAAASGSGARSKPIQTLGFVQAINAADGYSCAP